MLVILDIDGTLADIRPRMQRAGMQPGRVDRRAFQDWLDRLQSDEMLAADEPIPGMQELAIIINQFNHLAYVTGRDEKYRSVTEAWLDKHGFPSALVHMRPSISKWLAPGDYKEAVIKKLAKPGEHVIVIDDDPEGTVEKVCRKNGWVLLKVIL
jgi:FMN phosphatase YigB (HAD superfamily)